MDQLIPQIDMQRLPRHIAIIMDGNGRWARSRGENRSQGHIAGVESVRAVIKAAAKLGIGYLTLYTFSTENWNRPAEEVDMLLSLIVSELAKETPELLANNVRLSMIGDLGRLSPQARQSMLESMDATAACTGLNLILALSYSSRWEITDTIRRMAAQVADGTLAISDIDEQCVTDHLATAGIPDPDLLIRTGGDKRLSNFLLWQIAYAELYLTDIFWPAFNGRSLCAAIIQYQKRERRFGLTSDQIKNTKCL